MHYRPKTQRGMKLMFNIRTSRRQMGMYVISTKITPVQKLYTYVLYLLRLLTLDYENFFKHFGIIQ